MKITRLAVLTLSVVLVVVAQDAKKADPPKAPTISDTQKTDLIKLETQQLRLSNQIQQLQSQLSQAQLQAQQNGGALDKAISEACATDDKKWTLDIDKVECVAAPVSGSTPTANPAANAEAKK